MSSLTRDILQPDTNLLGGIRKLYLFQYQRYTRAEFIIIDNEINTFPEFEYFEVYGVNANFTQQQDTEGGAVFYNQTITFDVPKTQVNSELHKLAYTRTVAIYIDNIGNAVMVGAFNGLNASVTKDTGVELNSLNGYKVTLTGKEGIPAPYFNEVFLQNYLFEDGNNFIFEDEENYIFES